MALCPTPAALSKQKSLLSQLLLEEHNLQAQAGAACSETDYSEEDEHGPEEEEEEGQEEEEEDAMDCDLEEVSGDASSSLASPPSKPIAIQKG